MEDTKKKAVEQKIQKVIHSGKVKRNILRRKNTNRLKGSM